MPTSTYRGRRAVFIENEHLRVTILVEGGHIAEVLDKRSGINPLWTPQWDSIEPSTFDMSRHASYGGPVDGALLAGIMGHNLCLDIFGGPSPEEAAAGLTAHGEASVAPYAIDMNGSVLIARADLHARGPHGAAPPRTAARHSGDHGDGHESDRVRSSGRLDPARHARTTVSQERRDRVPRIGNPFESLRRNVRTSGLSRCRRNVRLARCTAGARRHGRSAALHRRAGVEQLHRAPDGPFTRRGFLRRL